MVKKTQGRPKNTVKSGNSLNSLKLKNRRDVLELIRHASPMSIAEIADRTSLSKVTATKILEHYIRSGLVVAAGKAQTGEERGKPPVMYALDPNHKFIYCVKMDGYNILATLTNLRGKVFASHTTLYDQRIELDQLIQSVGDAFAMLVQREGLDAADCLAAVAGLHGILDPESGVCFLSPQFPGWGRDIPMRDLLARHLPDMPIYVDNWVHYFGRGEASAMAEPVGRFFLISSEIEGINGALMVDGKLYRGHGCLSGEIGHMILDTTPGAEVCQCGGKGCFEAAVSPRRLTARVAKLAAKRPDSALHPANRTTPVAFHDIMKAADDGDGLARDEARRIARFFAIAIRNIMQTCDPALVIIQGEYAAAGRFFIDEVRSQVPQTSLVGMRSTLRIEYSKLGQYGSILGAANHAADIFFANA